MSQPDETDSDIPDRETCQKLTEQFAEITGTDEACAQFYLQDRKWDLEISINAFFETTQKSGVNILTGGGEGELVGSANTTVMNALGLGQSTSEPPSKFSFVSWNLDGLDERNLKRRTKAVCKIIYMEKPDVVFFQEMVPETFSYIEDKLPEYMCIAGNTDGYFTGTLLRKFTVYYDSHKITEHTGSQMMRNLLIVEAHIGPLRLQLVNTHLESTVDHATERIKQLKDSFKTVQDFPEDYTVLLAGDMNLRDKELVLAGGIPPGMEDLWLSCGSRKECQYTWDMVRNCNKEMTGKFKPRFRFDRAYIRHSHPKRAAPVHFGLVGIEKVTNMQCFPSDHWGLHVHFNIEKP